MLNNWGVCAVKKYGSVFVRSNTALYVCAVKYGIVARLNERMFLHAHRRLGSQKEGIGEASGGACECVQ